MHKSIDVPILPNSTKDPHMNLKDLPENQRVIAVDNDDIRVSAIRISPKKASVVWQRPDSNEEVLRTYVHLFTGEMTVESFSQTFWHISINGLSKSATDLNQFLGKSLSINADPAKRTLDVTTLVHHYTNINTLALILKHKTIRFSRLDRVDDVSEAQSFGKYDLAKYLFVSCWTDFPMESIPQWHMYTKDMAGVRITVPTQFFNYQPLRPPANWNAVVEGEILSPIPFERLITDDHFILPNIVNREQFERKVKYIDDLSSIYKDAVEFTIDDLGHANLKINRVGDLAGYKEKVWEFQSELRFVLFILPSISIQRGGISDENYLSQLPNHIINCILKSVPPQISYFDVEINPSALDNFVVTMGPLSTEGDMLLVDSLLKRYTKSGIVQQSALTGTIRAPIR